jgi:hypothetical protein
MRADSKRVRFLASITIIAAAALIVSVRARAPFAQPKDAGPTAPAMAPAVAAPTTDDQLKQMRGLLTDQAHVMMDVGYHFSGVWLATQQRNWPLARFYLDETRSHLHWAVRVRPVRKVSTGDEISLGNILEALESEGGPLHLLKAAIESKDQKKAQAAYRTMLEGCYACHKASEKPFLRLKIPSHLGDIINFDPAAKWPQ